MTLEAEWTDRAPFKISPFGGKSLPYPIGSTARCGRPQCRGLLGSGRPKDILAFPDGSDFSRHEDSEGVYYEESPSRRKRHLGGKRTVRHAERVYLINGEHVRKHPERERRDQAKLPVRVRCPPLWLAIVRVATFARAIAQRGTVLTDQA